MEDSILPGLVAKAKDRLVEVEEDIAAFKETIDKMKSSLEEMKDERTKLKKFIQVSDTKKAIEV